MSFKTGGYCAYCKSPDCRGGECSLKNIGKSPLKEKKLMSYNLIQINELRIGNLVEFECQILPVLSIDSDRELDYYGEMFKGCVSLPYIVDGRRISTLGIWVTRLKPIILTDELVIRLGWKYYNGKTSGDLTMDLNGKMDLDWVDGQIKVKSHYETFDLYRSLNNIKYVHQIQNLYYSHNHEELKHNL